MVADAEGQGHARDPLVARFVDDVDGGHAEQECFTVYAYVHNLAVGGSQGQHVKVHSTIVGHAKQPTNDPQ